VAHFECAQFLVCVHYALPSKRYANGGGYLHRQPSTQQCAALPLVLLDHNPDSDMVYLN
jgi:hypothetical protein